MAKIYTSWPLTSVKYIFKLSREGPFNKIRDATLQTRFKGRRLKYQRRECIHIQTVKIPNNRLSHETVLHLSTLNCMEFSLYTDNEESFPRDASHEQ